MSNRRRCFASGVEVAAVKPQPGRTRSPDCVCLSLRFIISTAPRWLTSANLCIFFVRVCLLFSFLAAMENGLFFFFFLNVLLVAIWIVSLRVSDPNFTAG